jgi:hypothetical protein
LTVEGAANVVRRAAGSVQQVALRTLLVAPASNLAHVDNEVQRVANALHPTLLFWNVTLTGVLDALQHEYDIVWFACHGTPDGVELSDGLLPTAQLVQMLRLHKPCLLVLNTCNSLQVAMQVHDEVGCAVICTVVSIPDMDAFVTGSQLAHALAGGSDIQQAYNLSKPGRNRQYVLLNGSVRMNGDTDGEDTNRLLMALFQDLSNRQSRTDSRLDRLERKVDSGFAAVMQAPSPIRRRAWVTGFLLLFAPVPLFYSNVREIVGVGWPFALLVALGCYGLSAAMFAYGNGVVGREVS